MLEEAQVLALVREGNTDAFAEIVKSYHEPIKCYLYHLTGDYEIAQDLTQDTFVKALENILRTKTDLSIKAWLYRIATNTAYNERKRLFSFITYKDRTKHDNHSIEKQPDAVDVDIAVREALLRVSDNNRICLTLHYIEGFKFREIAETLGISEAAVQKRVERGSDEFRKAYVFWK